MTAPPLLWTVEQAAKELAISPAHVYRLVAQKRIPFVRIGTSVRFRSAELEQWLADKQIDAVK